MQDIATTQDGGVSNLAVGSFTSNGEAVDVVLGFKPRHVRVLNYTDLLFWEWLASFAATHTLLTTGSTGAVTDNSASQIVPKGGPDGDFRGFTIGATAAGTSKVIHYIAFG